MKTQKTTRTYLEIDIGDIVSADENLRDAVPRLSNEGYGVFAGTEKQPASLLALAFAQDGLDPSEYLKLIKQHEPEIESLAANMEAVGLLEPIRVRRAEKGKYDLIYGCRRCLAWLYNYAKSGRKIPTRMTAEVVDADGKDSLLTSLSENMRVEPSPIDEAKSFRKLEKAFAMKASEIARATGKDEKVVRERLKLLKLPLEVQQRVHMGRLSQKNAIAMLKGKKPPMSSPDPRRVPPLKEIEKLYAARRDQLPAEYEPLVTEEVRRLFAHWLTVDYKPCGCDEVVTTAAPGATTPVESSPSAV